MKEMREQATGYEGKGLQAERTSAKALGQEDETDLEGDRHTYRDRPAET